MKMKMVLFLGAWLSVASLWAQTSTFTYQGRLHDNGAPASGAYDLRFTIYDAVTNGNAVSLVQTNPAVEVSNGLFTAQLDFGANVFNGNPRWLDIGVRTNGDTGLYISLNPRQPITSSPYAVQAVNATVANSANSVASANISGALALSQLPTAVITNGAGSVNLSGAFTGNGSGLTNLAGAQITGTVPDAALSSNVLAVRGVSIIAVDRWTNAGTYTVTVPAGVSQVTAKLWGAGGWKSTAGSPGGGGAYVQSSFPVTPGQTLTVVVGASGSSGGGIGSGNASGAPGAGTSGNGYGGGGGQGTSLFYNSGGSYILKALAGAGGGAAQNGGAGAPGGNSNVDIGNGTTGGYHGAGGGGNSPGQNYATNATTSGIASLNAAGGNGGAGNTAGGGGGGGYGGGGGGTYLNFGSSVGGGGGSYGDVVISGSSFTAGNTNDPYYVFPAGKGGTSTMDGEGEVVLLWQMPSATTTNMIAATRVSATYFTGDGSGLANVALLNGTNIFTGTNHFSNRAILTNANNQLAGTFSGTASGSFSGNGAGLTNLNLTGNGLAITNVPGAIPWQSVPGPAQNLTANFGYLVTNEALTTLTLPSAANVGDVVRISGIGGGGWKLAQNAGQSILARNLSGNSWPVWTARDTNRLWRIITCSADGTKLATAVVNGQIYISANSGTMWTPCTNAPATNWVSIASSADGAKLVALGANGLVYTSTDAGANWTLRSGVLPFSSYWQSVASSSDGSKLVAVSQNQQVYLSTDSGATWTPRNYTPNWMAVASSADGVRLAGVSYYGQLLYTSSDSGITWTAQANAGGANRVAIASSADGMKLITGGYSGVVQTSADGGVTWTTRSLPTAYWIAFAMSADGTRMAAAQAGGAIYTSSDSGVTWTAQNTGSREWRGLATTAAGTKLFTTAENGQIYTSTPATTTGTSGYLLGNQGATIELQSIGNNQWQPLSHEGTIQGY